VRERAVVFGDPPDLVGVLTEPDGECRDRGVIILNAGIIHRVGPNRLHVRMARALASLGFPVLRFDFSGQGDSGRRVDGSSYQESTALETESAIGLLQSATGVRDCLLMGICSGADAAFRAALKNEQVGGVAMIECFAFETRGYWLDFYARRALSPGVWLRRFRRFLSPRTETPGPAPRARDQKQDRDDAGTPSSSVWTLPPAHEVRAGMRTLLERGTHACFVLSAGGPSHYHYRRRLGRLGRRIAGGRRVDVRLAEQSDHTFTHLARQAWLVRQITEWAGGLPPGPLVGGQGEG